MPFTFAELIARVRSEKLAEPNDNFFDDDFMLSIAELATTDVAHSLGFPAKLASTSVAAGAEEVSTPEDAVPGTLRSVLFRGRPLTELGGYEEVVALQGYGLDPEGFFQDPRLAGRVFFAPSPTAAGDLQFIYQQRLYVGHAVTLGSDVWGTTWSEGGDGEVGNPNDSGGGNAAGYWVADEAFDHLEMVAVLATTVAAWEAGLQLERADRAKQLFELHLARAAKQMGVRL